MKNFLLIFFLVLSVINAQFKGEAEKPIDIKGSMINNTPSDFFLGFINPNNFSMHHSFSLSYSAAGSNGLALGVYTNSMAYKFNDKFNVELETSIVNSPYSTFGKNFSKQINGVYLSRAQINYNPSKDVHFQLQFSNSPLGYRGRYGYSPFSSYYNPFLDEFDERN